MKRFNEELEKMVPQKAWFFLKDACLLKGLNYKTACNKPYLQPNNGKEDGRVGGRKAFLRPTILKWLSLSDSEIEGGLN